MCERFPVAPCRAVASLPPTALATFDMKDRQGGAHPAPATRAEELRVPARVSPVPLLLDLLLEQIPKGGRRQPREELRGRQVLGRDADLGPGFTLGDPHGVVDEA